MFVAINQRGEKVWAKEVIEHSVAYFCPSCQSPVRLKKGKVLATHFAHVALRDCQSLSEGETAEHLAGKSLLLEWLPAQAELEAYLPNLKQRPDVLWGNLAFELQCSSLPFERFLERTQNYLRHRYYPWWILGKQFHPKKRWSTFQKACCYYDSVMGVKLWLMCQNTQEIRLCYHVQWHYQRGYEYQSLSFKAGALSLKDVLRIQVNTKPRDCWQPSVFQTVLRRKLVQCDASVLALQEKCYLQGGHLLHLPAWCYQASRYFFFFKEELLYFRWLYTVTSSYDDWKKQVATHSFSWFFPLIAKDKIYAEVYQECRLLAETKKISESKGK